MRIIAGDKRGTRLETLDGKDTRPTLERVKEGMFSSVQFILPGAQALDLFAGSGQLGLEALSRGASSCVFIDESLLATELIKKNAVHTKLMPKCTVASISAEAFLARNATKFDIVFLDPPYSSKVWPTLLREVAPNVAQDGVVLCESEPAAEFPDEVLGLVRQKQYRYGTVMVTKYIKENDA